MAKTFEQAKASFLECERLFPTYCTKMQAALSVTAEINVNLQEAVNVMSDNPDLSQIDEIARDILIFRSRLVKLTAKLGVCSDALKLVNSKTKSVWVQEFLNWLDLRSDLHQSFMAMIPKWNQVQADVLKKINDNI